MRLRYLLVVDQFPFYPLRIHRCRRKDYQEPVASRQGSTNFVMPLLRPANALPAIEHFETMARENFGNTGGKKAFLGEMGEENLGGLHSISWR